MQRNTKSFSIDKNAHNPFLSLIKKDFAGSLIRLTMRDHYIETYTDNGMQLIHMRFSDAITALHDFNGYQVHRSHWVNLDEVRDVKKSNRKHYLIMSDSAEIPVAQSRVKELKKMGIL